MNYTLYFIMNSIAAARAINNN